MNYATLPAFGPDRAIHVVIESPRGSALKLKYDPTLGVFTLSRPLPEGLVYPYDWGFVPSTLAADGDPLDAMVLWHETSFPGIVLRCRPLGVLVVKQNSKHHPGRRERNERLIVVPCEAPREAAVKSVDDLSVRMREEIESFFVASTAFESKDLAFEGWLGVRAAYALVKASQSMPRRRARSRQGQ